MTARRERLPTMGASNLTDTLLLSARAPVSASARATPRPPGSGGGGGGGPATEPSSSTARPTLHATATSRGGATTTTTSRSTAVGWKQPKVQTLRSSLLDPETSLFTPSKTWSQLRRRIALIENPSMTYDLDGDGFVGQEDYRLSKHLDADDKGQLHTTARNRGKRMIAEDFFKKHGEGIAKFGGAYKHKSLEDNVDELASDPNFPLVLRKLRNKERSLMGRASGPILSCMQLEGEGLELTKHNFYTDKFDATAWNDFDAIPRAASHFGLTDHGGSRKRLMFSRKQIVREGNQDKLDYADSLKPHYNTRKSNMITNIAMENS